MFACKCDGRIKALEEKVETLERMGPGSMKSDDALHLIRAITEDSKAFGRVTEWERNFLTNVGEFAGSSKWITQRQSVKLQEIYRRVFL